MPTLYWNIRGSTLSGTSPRRWDSTCGGGRRGSRRRPALPGAARGPPAALPANGQGQRCVHRGWLQPAGFPAVHVWQASAGAAGGLASSWMTEVLFTMYTCSMAMVGVSLIIMRRSELATCAGEGRRQRYSTRPLAQQTRASWRPARPICLSHPTAQGARQKAHRVRTKVAPLH